MPHNLCRRRACLYQRQLKEATTFFDGLVKSADPRLANAIQDPGLIGALEEILNIYVVYGVERDLNRLAPTKVLFLRDPAERPPLETVLPTDASKPVTYVAPDASLDSTVTMTTTVAYDRYFAWYVNPLDTPLGGVDPFFKRYPLLQHAVKTVTQNHKYNIELACERVARDWDTISAAFFAGNPMTKLIKIETTGNDFHKGGKQVLILTFQLTDPTYGRVVYKPSGVEIDCRIVGDSDIVNAPHVSPEGYHQDNSLTELINSFNPPRLRPEGFTSKPLPTYRILPYRRNSVPHSYGYIEYLTHNPPVKTNSATEKKIEEDVGTAVMNLKLTPTAVKQSDWLISDPADAQAFYHQLGGLMAMATALSLSDLHVQNAIAHECQPHLIDLEEAVKKPTTQVAETHMDEWLDAFRDPEGNALNIDNDRTSDLKATWGKQVGKPAPCALYHVPGTQTAAQRVRLADSDGERNRKALVRGFVDVVEALAVQKNNDAVKNWADGLGKTIARYVTLATATYAAASRRLYQRYCQNSPASLKQDGKTNPAGYANFPSNDGEDKSFFATAVSTRRNDWSSRFTSTGVLADWDWPPAPFFAVEHPDHAWRDYLNCDVPSFYHVLGDSILLNTNGDPVKVDDAMTWQDTNMGSAATALPQGWQPNAGGTYLPGPPKGPPLPMIKAQLDRLKTNCATPDGERAQLAAMLKGAGPLAPELTKLAGQIVDQKQQAGAGKVAGSVQ